MKLNKSAWEKLKSNIEEMIEIDSSITDVSINYQLKETEFQKKYARFNIKIEK
tara:strand:+ start:412 stop:570 length:159 start_codon:yes stop_codon:yes gene_type:complete